jgi:hypothetical protein
MERNKRDGVPIGMPPNPAPHITGWLIEIGLTEGGGMAAAPISWRSIRAWRLEVGLSLEPWQVRMLRRLSVEYLEESRHAESESRPPPWRAEVTQRERDVELQQLMLLLG